MAARSRRAAPPLFKTIVLSSRATLHRNLPGALFPERLAPEDMKRLRDKVCDAAMAQPGVLGREAVLLKSGDAMFDMRAAEMAAVGALTPAFAEHGPGTALLLDNAGAAIVVNDEDHATVTSHGPQGLDEHVKRVRAVAKSLEKRLPFARHPDYGYLSANPDNIGAGLRLYVSFCFFGLFLNKEIDAVLRGIERIGLAVYPLYASSEKEEGPLEAPGCCYVVASTQTMGPESHILSGMLRVCHELEMAEANARLRLVESRPGVLIDFLARSVAVGCVAAQMGESEGLDIIHAVLFGLDMGAFSLPPEGVSAAHDLTLGMTHAGLRRLVDLPEPEKPAAASALPVGAPDAEAAAYEPFRAARAYLLRQFSTLLLPQCAEKFGYRAVVEEMQTGEARRPRKKRMEDPA